MKLTITFRNMDHSDLLHDYALNKFAKVRDFLEGTIAQEPTNVHIILTAGRTHHHHEVELHIQAPHYSTVIKRENPDMNLAIDQVMDIAVRELTQHKERLLDKRDKSNNRPG